jgi:hypothetical protein
LYPADFRDRFADDLLQAFDDRRSEARFTGGSGGLRLVIFLLRDFVTSVPLARQQQRNSRGVDGIMFDFLRDLQFSVRMLLKNPTFTVAAVMTLALGIGLNAATFSVIHGILLRPLPGAHAPEELVQIYRLWPGLEYGAVSIPHYQDLRDRTGDVFESVGAWFFEPVSISADGRSERTIALVVSANFFQTYGVTSALDANAHLAASISGPSQEEVSDVDTRHEGVEIPGYDFAEGERSSLNYTYVSEGYIETMGIEIIEGRAFTRMDDDNGPPVIIVNQRFSERFWPNESALGKIVETAGGAWEVGVVVETGKYNSLGEDPTEFMYLPYRVLFRSDMTLVARTSGDPQVVLRSFREVVRAADPDMPVYDVRSMEDHMGMALLPARFGGAVLGLFGLLSLTLAAVGIYSVMAYSVSQRTRELGIRVALGADRASVVQLVLGEGLRLAVIGTVIGLVGAFGAARLVQGMLYDVGAFDPVAFTAVPATLLLVATIAVYLPARRAASVDPMRALKTD